MKAVAALPLWSFLGPLVAWLVFVGAKLGLGGGLFSLLVFAGLVWAVLCAVHHAEVVAHRVGEPFGTLLLAFAVTVLEVGMIVSMMMSATGDADGLARDTVFAAIMIILTGMMGLSLLLGGLRHHEQAFGTQGVSAALVTLAAIVGLTMILPNYTVTEAGPYYGKSQLVFISIVSLVLYGSFVFVQTVRHRSYFVPAEADGGQPGHASKPTARETALCAVLLVACLGAVILLAKVLAPDIESAIDRAGAPKALVGVVIATVVLLPECLAAFKAARQNRLQTSLNLSLGSALASIGLTIPAVAMVSLLTGARLALGLDLKSTVLLMLALFSTVLSLATGRTTIMQGVVHLVLFAVYLFMTIVP